MKGIVFCFDSYKSWVFYEEPLCIVKDTSWLIRSYNNIDTGFYIVRSRVI
jgi:hypothetical protein